MLSLRREIKTQKGGPEMKATRKFLILTAVVLGMLPGTLGVSSAITNGQPDGDTHPYVGLIVFDDENGPAWRCTGTLLSSTVVLTAGHCTDGAVAARVWFDPQVIDPDYPNSGGTSVEAAGIHTHPDFCLGCGNGLLGLDTRDVGVIVLSEPVPLSEYGQLPDEGLVDTLRMKTDVTAVGYGVQSLTRGNPPHFWAGLLARFFAPTKLIASNQMNSDEFIKLTANPARGKGGTCFGDSGGPDLLTGTDTVLAVNSYVTNFNCTGVTYSNRIDIEDVLAFIKSYLPHGPR